MVTTIYNITRDMQSISCYVDNGFGTPMQASRSIKIERKPSIKIYPQSKSIIRPLESNIRIGEYNKTNNLLAKWSLRSYFTRTHSIRSTFTI